MCKASSSIEGYIKVTFELMSARKRASSVKNDGGFCALKAHKNRHHFLREQAPQAQGSHKAAFE